MPPHVLYRFRSGLRESRLLRYLDAPEGLHPEAAKEIRDTIHSHLRTPEEASKQTDEQLYKIREGMLRNAAQALNLLNANRTDAEVHAAIAEANTVLRELRQTQGYPPLRLVRIAGSTDCRLDPIPHTDILREHVDQEYTRIRQALLIRISGSSRTIEQRRKEMNAMSWIQHRIAVVSGVWSGMERSLLEDQRLLGRARELLERLGKEGNNPDLTVRRASIDRIRELLGMSRPDYRDANADLARATDRLNTYDVMRTVPERQPFTEGQEVYVLENEETVEKKWKISRIDGDKIQVTKDDKTLSLTTGQVWHVHEIESGRALNPNVPRHTIVEMLNRKHTLIERYARISKEEYHELFDGPLQQQNTSNCYLIAAFESLRQSPHAEAVLRTSIQRQGDGYAVKIPLGDADGVPITISRGELGPMKVQNDREGRSELHPVRAAEGWVVLEAAFTKKKFGTVNRLASEGGWGNEALALMFGRAVTSVDVDARTFFRNTDLRLPFSGHPDQRKKAERWLDAFSRQRNIATASLPRQARNGPATVAVAGHTFYKNHAYAVLNVDARGKTLTLANPYDTSVHIHLTYDQFLDTFASIREAAVDYRRIFRT
jgi:hypothetical protein